MSYVINEDREGPTHVDEFINYGSGMSNHVPNERYARWVLNHFRLPAICKLDFDEFMKDYLLFCIYEGKKYRVPGASSLGDVWLHHELDPIKANSYYEKELVLTILAVGVNRESQKRKS